VLLAAVAGLLRLLATRSEGRSEAVALTVVTAAALVVPVALALAGEDHVVTRNVLAALPLALALAGAGLAAIPRAAALATGAAACALALVAVLGVDLSAKYQRDDWRGAARALGPSAAADRIIVAAPGALVPLRYYLPGLRALAAPPPTAADVDYVAVAARSGSSRIAPPRPTEVPLPGPGFEVAGRTEGETFTVIRTHAAVAAPIDPRPLAAGLDGLPAQVLEQPSVQK
jgi:hypothetical protein